MARRRLRPYVADRIHHVVRKDTRLRLGGGRNGRPSSHLPWGDPRGGWDVVSIDRLHGAPEALASLRRSDHDPPSASFAAVCG